MARTDDRLHPRAVVLMAAISTQRDLAVLRWTGEQSALPMTVLAKLLARDGLSRDNTPRVAARLAARLERLGYADRRRLAGRWWLVPTRRGLRAAGLPYEPWQVEEHEWSLRHVALVALLRLHLEHAYPEARWESERAIRRRWSRSGARVRLADGGLEWPDGDAVGIELERYVKKLPRYQSAVMDVDPDWTTGVWWFTPAAQVPLLSARLTAAGGGDRHQVYPLPAEVAL
jgi:hypothetical protein